MAGRKQLYELTPDHRAQLKPWADRWIANALSTKAMDDEERDICRKTVNGMYAAAKLPPPKHIVFVPSPFVLAFAGGFAAGLWHLSKSNVATEAATWAATEATWAATLAATWAATRAATEAATWAATLAATRAVTWDARDAARATRAATWDARDAATSAARAATEATRAATEATWAATEATRAATQAATWAATLAATWAATRAATDAATRAATWDARDAARATREATEAATRAATDAAWEAGSKWYTLNNADMGGLASRLGPPEFLLDCARHSWRMWDGGNQTSGYISYISFFRHVAQLDIDYTAWDHREQLALHSGPRIVHPDFCMISDRPEVLLLDEQNRPHCDDGPFCRWRDGSALYAIHGVRVPQYVVEQPERITLTAIDAESNAEVRRVMIERYGIGRYMANKEAHVVDICGDDHPVKGLRGSRLLTMSVDGYDRPITMIECINSTAEPDGTFKRYHLAVNPKHYGGRAGRECLAAMASTWRNPYTRGLMFERPEDYAPEAET